MTLAEDSGKDRAPTYREKKKKNDEAGCYTIGRQNTLWDKEIKRKCEHDWKPISIIINPRSGQPDITNARTYCVCMKCLSHTYVETAWAGYYIGSPDLLEEALVDDRKPDVEGCGP